MCNSKPVSIFRKGRMHSVFVNFPFLIQLIRHVTFSTWRKKWRGRENHPSHSFYDEEREEWVDYVWRALAELLRSCCSHACTQGISLSSLIMIKDSTKVLLSWKKHYFYEVQPILYKTQFLPKGKTQGIISCTCSYNCTLLCTVALKALQDFSAGMNWAWKYSCIDPVLPAWQRILPWARISFHSWRHHG